MRKVALAGLLGALATGLGCTALLGDFDVGPGSSSGNTADAAGGDSSTTGADGASDAPDDVFDAQSTVFTTCGANGTRIIEVIDDANAGFAGSVQIFRTGNNVRAIVRKKTSEGAFVYSFDPKSGNPGTPVTPTKVDLGAAGRYFDARRLTNQAIVSLLFLERDMGVPNPYARMMVYELPDNDLAGANKIRVSKDFPAPPQNANLAGALGGYANNNEYFWAFSVPTGNPGEHDLLIGHRISASAQPTPIKIFTGEERDVRVRDIARSQTTQFIFNDRGPDGPSDPGAGYFPVPQDTTSGPIAVKHLQPVGSTKPFAMLAVSGIPTGNGIRAAFAEIDFSGTGGGPGQLRIGEVAEADLPTLDGSKVPPAFTLGSLLEAPLGGMEGRFFGDEFLWIGTPPEPQRGQGLNFIWYNVKSRIIRSRQTGMQKLLAAHPNILGASLNLISQTGFQADLDLVFVEEVAGKSALAYTSISCVR